MFSRTGRNQNLKRMPLGYTAAWNLLGKSSATNILFVFV